jgi:hypothetical protein
MGRRDRDCRREEMRIDANGRRLNMVGRGTSCGMRDMIGATYGMELGEE